MNTCDGLTDIIMANAALNYVARSKKDRCHRRYFGSRSAVIALSPCLLFCTMCRGPRSIYGFGEAL